MDSLFTQDCSDFKLIVRDDGSTDATLSILQQYQENYKGRIDIIYGEHLGVVKSYFELLKQIPDDAAFVGLADQDDVWFPFKISRAVSVLNQYSEDIPILYGSALQITDEKLNVVCMSQIPKNELSFRNILLGNTISGCTMFLNNRAIELVRNNIICSPSPKALMHDWWLALFISIMGKLIFDDKPTIFYRRHACAVTNTNTATLTRGIPFFIFRARQYFTRKNYIYNRISEFMQSYAPVLPVDTRNEIYNFIYILNNKNIFGRLKYAFVMPFYRQTWYDNLAFKILITLKMI